MYSSSWNSLHIAGSYRASRQRKRSRIETDQCLKFLFRDWSFGYYCLHGIWDAKIARALIFGGHTDLEIGVVSNVGSPLYFLWVIVALLSSDRDSGWDEVLAL